MKLASSVKAIFDVLSSNFGFFFLEPWKFQLWYGALDCRACTLQGMNAATLVVNQSMNI
jgi:hypothetical protein